MHRRELLNLLDRHRSRFMEEAAYINRAREFVQTHPDCFERDLWPAHVTGSSWVVNPERSHVLMLHHRKHEQWFQPGGHAEGEVDILGVALRETAEETGVAPEHIKLVDRDIFDVDIHSIPPTDYGPEHQHIDIRFLVEIDDRLALPGNVESHEVRWIALPEVPRFNNNRSTFRMVDKTRRMAKYAANAAGTPEYSSLRR